MKNNFMQGDLKDGKIINQRKENLSKTPNYLNQLYKSKFKTEDLREESSTNAKTLQHNDGKVDPIYKEVKSYFQAPISVSRKSKTFNFEVKFIYSKCEASKECIEARSLSKSEYVSYL